jgi:hypothetical protein
MDASVTQALNPDAVIEGSCACGRIKYAGSKMPTSMTNCHCRQCQKLAGAPYLTWAAVERASLTWTTTLPQPKEHIFLAEKAPWFKLPDDGLAGFEEFDPPFQSKLETWKRENMPKS